jgi:signal transduction histidine kinase
VEISDNGPGIPDEFRQRIFQKFSQADSSDTRKKGGTGLGLSISKAIIERMDGTIGFSTEEPGGHDVLFRAAGVARSAAGHGAHGARRASRARARWCMKTTRTWPS